MIITDYISKEIVSFNENDIIQKVKQTMIDLQITHIPISNKGKLIGNLCYEIIKDLEDEDKIQNHLTELEDFYLYEKAIIFDSIHSFSENQANILPIINAKGKFLGCVLEEDIIDELASFSFIKEFGVFITIVTPIQKYSISEIANIVESNNGRILGLVVINTDQDTTRITLKINAENISSIGDTFERFGYQISNKYFEDFKQQLLKDRFDLLKKFMEV